ncbi:MAG: L-aspartate oxidase [Gemmatales bacterium]|nr:L-aspartate oxidase [Gemmatales bacterium]MDW7995442.1 L-aspartate oxidase [Gemmatales bacterium]
MTEYLHELPGLRRYLVGFHGRRLPHYFTDILILGAGLAGLRAALAVDPELDVLVVTKDRLPESSSFYAQGGIASVMDAGDRFEDHERDTLQAGDGLCDATVVARVVREAPQEIELLQSWGARFDEEGPGKLKLGREGGHSYNRIVHVGDATGQEVMRVVIAQAQQRPHITIWDNTFTLDLLTAEGQCVGAMVHRRGELMLVWARQTILATGGAGQLYRETTNPAVATGDGIAMAWRAGAQVRDMEFMQFHPTVLYVAGSARYLITEATRGAGAVLRDRTGYRFMPGVHPMAELAPRDIVARAIVRQMEKTQHPCVYLDMSHLDAERIRREFPGIVRVCTSFGLDISRDWIPVRPAAHYLIGGVWVDGTGRTSLPGLWACGEVTSSGLHGANRLASNSLLESLVFGRWCGQGASQQAAIESRWKPPLSLSAPKAACAPDIQVTDLRNALQSLLWRKAGILRTGPALQEALHDVLFWARYVLAQEFGTPAAWELQNLMTNAWMLVWSALQRRESRGVHYREDFPERDDQHWLRHIHVPAPQFVARAESHSQAKA